MKSLLACLFCGLLSLSFIHGAPAVLNPNVEKPPYPDFIKHSQYSACGLKDLLAQGKLEDFYKRSKKLLKENGRVEDKNTEQCQNELWTFYYIAAAPLFQMDASPEIPASWREDKTLDYDVKTSAARYIATQDIDRLAAVLSVSREKIAGLYALYAAKILHDIKQNYDPDLGEKQKRQLQEEEEKKRLLYRDRKIDINQANLRSILIHNKISTEDLRNNAAKMRTDSLEKTFLNLLVEYFPGNAALVRKYIKLAGYSDKEIPNLIDRTVGRESKTEFLYKGAGRKKRMRL
jgi:hypothetical protein